MNRSMTALICLALAASVSAQDQIEPIGPSLEFIIVSKVNEAEQTVSFCNFVMVEDVETRTRTVEKDGKLREEVYEVTKYVYQVEEWETPLKELRLFTARGERIEDAEVPRRLTAGKAVLLFPNDQKLDKRFVGLLKDNALIVTLPQDPESSRTEPEPEAPGAPVPAPRGFEPGPSVPDAPPAPRPRRSAG